MMSGDSRFKRCNVIGTSGSGKSTFSRQLADMLSVSYIELDALFWGPNWSEASDEDFFAKLAVALKSEGWVLDGNYTRTIPIKWAAVDCVIWLDYSFVRTVRQSVKRALGRSLSGREIWVGTGNRETFRKSFMSRDSIIWWTIQTYRKNRQRNMALMQDPTYNAIQFVRLRSPREATAWLNTIR